MKKKIWFNRWFSTAYHFIEAIRNNPDGQEYEFFGTHPNPDTVYLQLCDYAEAEPDLEDEAYIQYCLEFCRRHHIDVFIPYHNGLEISRHISRFEELGTKVLISGDFDKMAVISHKRKLYESFRENGLDRFVPDYWTAGNAAQFEQAYQRLRSMGKEVCIKPVDGRGGEGFRIIRSQKDTLQDLFGHVTAFVSYEEVSTIFSSQKEFPELMVMELLEGYEYSIDCLAYGGQLLAAVPRKKSGGRVRELENNRELLKLADDVNRIYNLSYVYNIQVKYSGGVPKLLEINPRMSGGLHISSLSGINFAYQAVKLLLSGTADIGKADYQIKAAHIETPVLLNGQ